MNSSEAMVVWTPNREPFEHDATRGKVAVIKMPEDPRTKGYTHSTGACDAGWGDMSEGDRQKKLQKIATQMIGEDNIKRDDVEKAFSSIDGWRGII